MTLPDRQSPEKLVCTLLSLLLKLLLERVEVQWAAEVGAVLLKPTLILLVEARLNEGSIGDKLSAYSTGAISRTSFSLTP